MALPDDIVDCLGTDRVRKRCLQGASPFRPSAALLFLDCTANKRKCPQKYAVPTKDGASGKNLHALPREALLREGTVTVAVGQRCQTDNHKARKMFIDELGTMSQRIETPEYRQRMERYQYLYKGREVWRTRPRKGGRQ